jgi:hypothetical protein
MERALEVDFPPERKAEDSYDLETTGEIFQKLFRDDEVDPEHIDEVKRSGSCFPAGSCVSLRLSPEQSLHQIPESANLRSSDHQQLRFRASACS